MPTTAFRYKPGTFFKLTAAVCSLLPAAIGHAQTAINIPMQPARWHALQADSMGPKGDPVFSQQEGFPQGLMTLKAGSVALDGTTFSNGTIEYDFKALSEDAPGIQFRVTGDEISKNGEEFYVRISSDCRASNDCVQYTPLIHGFMLWDVYPQYQHQAFILDGWNHVRLVVSGQRMLVYINGLPEPALSVTKLESGSLNGTIHLRGPAVFANLVITPGKVNGLAPQPTPDPTLQDPSIVHRAEASDPIAITSLTAPSCADMPKSATAWHLISAERGGLLNLNRLYIAGDQPAAINWLRYNVNAKQSGIRQVSMGWLGEVWIFVNGELVGDGKNFYYPPSERRAPDGRISLQNGTFNLPLKAGSNEIAIAMYSQVRDSIRPRMKYGWGMIMRYSSTAGLSFSPPPAPVSRTRPASTEE